MEAGQVDVQQELERLRVEVEELRAARARLVRAADADRRAIERELHGGVHQRLVALATSLQLARLQEGSAPAGVETLLQEMTRDVRQALDQAALLAQGIYPSALELGGLAPLLRAAAVNAGVRATVDVSEGSKTAPEIAMTVYLCWLALLARGRSDGRPVTIAVGEDEEALTFEIVGEASGSDEDLEPLQDRVAALGGRLTIAPEPGGGVRLTGSLPR